MKLYDRIEYVGISKSYTLTILPRRNKVTITSDTPYKFKEDDSQDERALSIYRSLYSAGIRLIPVSTSKNEVIDDKSEDTEVKTEEKNTQINKTDNDSIDNNEVKTEEIENENSQEENKELVNTPIDATEGEMIEFLDLNYDEESVKNVARDTGIKRIQGSWDKQTIINKVIESNPEYVIKLMKSNI